MDNITIVETFSALLLLSKSREHLSCHIYRTCARRGACLTNSFFPLHWRHFFRNWPKSKRKDSTRPKKQEALKILYVPLTLPICVQTILVETSVLWSWQNITLASWLTNGSFFFIFLNQQLLGNLSKVLCRDFVIFPFVTCIARLAGVILASRMGSPGPFAISESTCAGSPSGSIPLLKAKPQKSA